MNSNMTLAGGVAAQFFTDDASATLSISGASGAGVVYFNNAAGQLLFTGCEL